MADRSSIEWTDATWSPVTGCTRVSKGCEHCYIERTPPFRMSGRRFDRPGIGATTGVQLHPERLDQPLRWRKPRRVFVCSMADLFHRSVPDEYIADVWAHMWWSPQHTFQVLTKRHARMREVMPRLEEDLRQREHDLALVDCPTPLTWPLPNVWLGVSAENQMWADIRIPSLLDTPAAVRWVSAEPLLGPIDLHLIDQVDGCTCAGGTPESGYMHERHCGTEPGPTYGQLHWVVTGGESGPGHRPADPDWFRHIRDQCQAAGVAYLHKQNGGPTSKAGGRELDGRTWDEYPTSLVGV